MIDSLTSSEAQLLRILREVGAVTEPFSEDTVWPRWGRSSGLAGYQDLVTTMYALQFKGLVEPGNGALGNVIWTLTPSGVERAQDIPNNPGSGA
jgi:hypothetical protein